MKTNKITLMVMGLAVACLLASCKKDNDNSNDNNTPADGKGFIGYTEWNGGNRTHGVPNGNIIAVNWTEVDEILVANQSGDTLTYTLSEGKDSTVGKFESERQTDEFLEPNYAAIYPAKNAEGVKNNITVTADGITATFNLPATQNYLENSFAEKSMPMAAYSENQIFQFRNVLGGICFPLVGEGMTVTKVVLTSAASNEALWGTCTTTISTDGSEPTSTVSNAETTKNVITLNCGSGITLGSDPTDFYIMVPAGTLGTGFTVEAFNGETSIYSKTADWSASPVDNFIPRSVIRKVNHNLEIVVAADPVSRVTTISPTFITKETALGLGLADATPYQCGILYAKEDLIGTPSDEMVIGGNYVTNVSSVPGERFDANLSGLDEDQKYYVRAYVRNADGTIVYGAPILFATRYDYYGLRDGKSRSTFSVSDGQSVYFSMGNLRYKGTESPTYFHFAANQFDILKDSTNQLLYNVDVDRDLFSWGTSWNNHGANGWWPWCLSYYPLDFNAYGNSALHLNSSTGQADWGSHAIKNGGDTPNAGWRTLQGHNVDDNTNEWIYMLNPIDNPGDPNAPHLYSDANRTCDYRYAHAIIVVQGTSNDNITTVNGDPACGRQVAGLIIFPDEFTWPSSVGTFAYLNITIQFSQHVITEAQWSLLEQAGAVFLPNGGYINVRKDQTTNSYYGIDGLGSGYYWSATAAKEETDPMQNSMYTNVYYLGVQNGGLEMVSQPRNRARSVRLVYPANQGSGNFNNQPFGVNP